MPRYREPFTLYSIKTKDGKRVWYYRTYTPEGNRTSGKSTGKASKAEAYDYCNGLLRSGELIPAPKAPRPPAEVRRSRRPPTLDEWVKERHWWEWTDSGPACLYCVGELARSSKDAPAIQRHRANTCTMVLKTHILPTLGPYRMDQVTPAMCEELMASWRAKGLAAKTINDYASVARVMFGEAARLSVITASPWEHVRGYYAERNAKGILSLDEYKRLMDPAKRADYWPQPVYYAIHLLASVTGLRAGECLAIKVADLHEDHITVSGSWDIKYGMGPQKTKRGTDQLPIPRYVYNILAELVPLAHGGYLFSLGDGSRPCTAGRSFDALERALGKIGITPEARKARKLSPHSWRAFANTYFRASGVPDAKVREITRHESEEMTEHYSAWRLEDFREIAAAQVALIEELKNK
jgi:integrase